MHRLMVRAVVLGLACVARAQAQAATASTATATRELQLSATALMSGGNLARVVVQSRLGGSVGNETVQFVTENAYRFGQNGSRIVEDDALSRNYVRVLPLQRGYGYLLGVLEANHRRSIEQRWQLGLGAAWNVSRDSAGDFLRAGLAVVQEQARFRVATFNLGAYNGNATIEEPRAIVRVGGRHALFERHLVLGHDTWYMAGLRHRDADRAHTLLSMQVPVVDGFSFRGEYDYTYERLTISGNNPLGFPASRDDWVLSFGVAYEVVRRVGGTPR